MPVFVLGACALLPVALLYATVHEIGSLGQRSVATMNRLDSDDAKQRNTRT